MGKKGIGQKKKGRAQGSDTRPVNTPKEPGKKRTPNSNVQTDKRRLSFSEADKRISKVASGGSGKRAAKVARGGEVLEFEVPEDEPIANARHRLGVTKKAVNTGVSGTVYARSPRGASTDGLRAATEAWLKKNKPEALDSKPERIFRQKGWSLIWTPPYCPTFQPIEEFWGVGKQRAGIMYTPGRTLEQVKGHLRMGWYGAPKGEWHDNKERPGVNCGSLVRRSEEAVDHWIAKDIEHNEVGLTGSLKDLGNIDKWTDTGALDGAGDPVDFKTYLNIDDMDDGGNDESEEEDGDSDDDDDGED